MTRKDFQLIANVLNAHHNAEGVSRQVDARALAVSFASELAKTNPRFNATQFVNACLKK